jgi:carboxyl-terminal processing protease
MLFARASAAVLAAALALSLGSGSRAASPVSSDLSALDLIELQIGYTTLLATYYRPVSPRALAGGARTGIASYLLSRGIAEPALAYAPEHLDRGTAGDFIDSAVVGSVLRYGKRVSPDAVVQAALAGETAAVGDPYTLLFHPQQFKKFNAYLNGDDFGGIGAVVTLEAGGSRARVESVIAQSPAERAGLQAADEIVAIDAKPLPSDGAAVRAALRGKIGTTVRLSVVRAGAALAEPLAVTRARIVPPLVLAKMLEPGIGYVQLTRFGDDAAAQLLAALGTLEQRGARALVLDLRGNGGGYGDEAKKVASAFVPSGPIFTTRERGGATTVERAGGKAAFTGRLAVLVDGDTASAAEIVAGALQDDGLATLVGTKTFGKGVVQSVFPLPDGAALKVTTARYFTPKGRNIEGTGLMPDVVVAQPADAKRGDPATDPQLARAVRLLRPGSHFPAPA